MDKTNSQSNMQLLYEVNMYQRKVDLEITAAEKQLASVEGRLVRLKHDLYVYLGFILVPLLLSGIFDFLITVFFHPMVYIVFTIASFLCICAFVILFIPSTYNLIKTIILLHINRESDEPALLPPAESSIRGGKAPQEESYRSERDKLVLVLGRYYVYREKLEQLHQKINSETCNMTLVELSEELRQMPVFEDIQPASDRTGAMGELVKGKTKKIMCAIILAVILSLIIGVLV